jgi:hypothetical protein
MLTEEENRNEPENQNETRAEYKQPELAKELEGEAHTDETRGLHPRRCSRDTPTMLTEKKNPRNKPENQSETGAEGKQTELAKKLEGEAYTDDARGSYPRRSSRLTLRRCSQNKNREPGSNEK